MKPKRKRKLPQRFKSKLEQRFAAEIFKRGLRAEYEPQRFEFIRTSHYTPDWGIGKNTFVETKGYLSPSNRSNLISFREQHPGVEILLAFQCGSNKLSSKSNTTYGEWATKNGFKWCDLSKGFPSEWWDL